MSDIYGEDILCRISLVRIFCDEVDSPAEGGPHMVFVSTDEGVRYSDGSLLETTASQADKVTMMIMIMIIIMMMMTMMTMMTMMIMVMMKTIGIFEYFSQ